MVVKDLVKALAPIKECGPCAARTDEAYEPYTCYTRSQLHRMIASWNAMRPNQQIHVKESASRKESWEALRTALHHVCGENEACWAKASGAYGRFSPAHKVPVSFTDGITTDRLAHGMKQFIRAHPSKYLFTGVHPNDFSAKNSSVCVGGAMCSLTVRSLLEDHKKQGFCMILNTDPHFKTGDHWVAFFCGLDAASPNFGCYYYDSNRVRSVKQDVSPHVRGYVKRLEAQAAEAGIKKRLRLRVQGRVHQRIDGPCGLFAMAFCMVCLLDLPIKHYMSSSSVNDDLMAEVMASVFLST